MYNFELKNGTLFIYLDGQIDSTNADLVLEELNNIIKNNPFEKLVLDGATLRYISSAGLRNILKILRNYRNMEIRNLSDEVYNIFEMTGFTQMMTIKKAFKELNLEGAKVIGEGAKGIIYNYKDDLIVKIYKDDDSLPQIDKERELAKYAFILGIPTAISYDIVKVNGKYGIAFELLNAKSMSALIIENKDKLEDYAKEFVKLLKIIHGTKVDPSKVKSEMVLVNKWLQNLKLVSDEETYNKVLNLINNLKETNTLIHGDYHTNNVMMQNGELLLIDMDTLAYANPIIELGIIDFSYKTFNELDNTNSYKFLGIDYDTALKFYEYVIDLYFSGLDKEKVERNKNRIKLVSLLRIINHVYKRNKDSVLLVQAMDELKSLLNIVTDLNLE